MVYLVGDFLIFQYIPEREPYQLGTRDTELVNIVTINFAFIWLLVVSFFPVGTEEAAKDKGWLICFFSLPFISSSLPLLKAAELLPQMQQQCGSIDHINKGCAAASRLPAPLSPHRLGIHQSSNLHYFYWSGGLSAALLPIGIGTTQDFLNMQKITHKKKKKKSRSLPSLILCLGEDH